MQLYFVSFVILHIYLEDSSICIEYARFGQLVLYSYSIWLLDGTLHILTLHCVLRVAIILPRHG